MEYQRVLEKMREEETKFRREADLRRSAIETMERLIQDLEHDDIDADNQVERVARVRPQPTPQPQNPTNQWPEIWEPAGFTSNPDDTYSETIVTRSRKPRAPRVNHPTQNAEEITSQRSNQGAVRRPILTAEYTRPPRHIRRLEVRRREQEKEVDRGRYEARQNKAKAFQLRKNWLRIQEIKNQPDKKQG